MWPYTQTHEVTIPEDEFKNMDKWVDSITNNIKMNLLTHVRLHHPALWSKYTPFEGDKLGDLSISNVEYRPSYTAKKTNL